MKRRTFSREFTVIKGRPLIPGRSEPEFPAFYRIETKPVTFRLPGARPRVEREEYVIGWFERVRHSRKLVLLMIPHGIAADPSLSVFLAGWTLTERDGEVRTRQMVVFLRDEVQPVGASDQGVICVARRDRLSAWDGKTMDQSRAQAA